MKTKYTDLKPIDPKLKLTKEEEEFIDAVAKFVDKYPNWRMHIKPPPEKKK